MQTLARCSVLCAVALLGPCSGTHVALRAGGRQRSLQAAEAAMMSSQMAAIARVEAEDRRFWSAQWKSMEDTLLQLLQVSGAPVANNTHAKGGNASGGPVVANATSEPKRHSPLQGLKLNLDPKTPADLVPALGMLKSLYEDGKKRVSELNANEKKMKMDFDDRQANHNARIAEIEARFKNHTLSEEFHKNETRDENRLFTYWQRVRERQHRQYHTSLKIQHGTLSKVKNMIDVYEKTISGKADKAEVKKDLAKVGVMPDVVLLLQDAWQAAAPFFGDALAEVRAASSQLA